MLHVEMVSGSGQSTTVRIHEVAIPLSAKELLVTSCTLRFMSRRETYNSDDRLCVGRCCHSAINKTHVGRKAWIENVYTSLREGSRILSGRSLS